MKYVAPLAGLKSFTCPHCGVLSRQYHWGYPNQLHATAIPDSHLHHTAFQVSKCEHCENYCLWSNFRLVFPNRGGSPLPNPHMPENVKGDYEEAAQIALISPRGAAALLRLGIQKLCVHLGGAGDNINEDIALLVKNGLPSQVQQALDVVRVTGNNAVHPGQIDVNDSSVAEQLFPLVNLIVEYMIDLPSRISRMYDSLPEGALKAIERRDGK